MSRVAILFCLAFGLPVFSFGQSAVVKGKNYEGVIFDSSVFVFKSIDGQKSRCDLTGPEVAKAERILHDKLKGMNTARVNQTSGCPVIHKRLRKYYRQYVGFVDQQGGIVIWINLFWDKEMINRAKKEIVQVHDGCSYFWNIEVNITTGELKNLSINGAG